MLALQDENGMWGGGIYDPKWTSTTYTLLDLCHMGVPRDCEAAQRGAGLVLAELFGDSVDARFRERLVKCDRCIVGMALQIAAYFRVEDERVTALVENLLAEKMPDDGWNCRRLRRPRPTHSSFHTTFNVMEGLREYLEWQGSSPLAGTIVEAEKTALEFMLQHQLFRSDKTGAIIDEKFTLLSFPPRWHYDVLRGLAYFARVGASRDDRLEEAIRLLCSKHDSSGYWPLEHRYGGKVFFAMEATAKPSRWNTLRACRVLRWWLKPG